MELRFYTFVNFYLSPIQAGIQTGHCAVELKDKYVASGENDGRDYGDVQNPIWVTNNWSRHHKTFVVLNGGAHQDILDKYLMMARETPTVERETGVAMPWASFSEDQYSLGGIMTCVGVVLSEKIFNAMPRDRAVGMVRDPSIFTGSAEMIDSKSWFYMEPESSVSNGGGEWVDEGKYFVGATYPAGSATARFIEMVKSARLF